MHLDILNIIGYFSKILFSGPVRDISDTSQIILRLAWYVYANIGCSYFNVISIKVLRTFLIAFLYFDENNIYNNSKFYKHIANNDFLTGIFLFSFCVGFEILFDRYQIYHYLGIE